MRCHSVACGMASQTPSATQSVTLNFQSITPCCDSRYDETGNVMETHQHAGEFKDW
jgi:hypothetical protein